MELDCSMTDKASPRPNTGPFLNYVTTSHWSMFELQWQSIAQGGTLPQLPHLEGVPTRTPNVGLEMNKWPPEAWKGCAQPS